MLDISDRRDRGVDTFLDEAQHDTQENTDDRTDRVIDAGIRLDRPRRNDRRRYNAYDIVDHLCQFQLDGLPLGRQGVIGVDKAVNVTAQPHVLQLIHGKRSWITVKFIHDTVEDLAPVIEK